MRRALHDMHILQCSMKTSPVFRTVRVPTFPSHSQAWAVASMYASRSVTTPVASLNSAASEITHEALVSEKLPSATAVYDLRVFFSSWSSVCRERNGGPLRGSNATWPTPARFDRTKLRRRRMHLRWPSTSQSSVAMRSRV